jgi:hypothetical protein
LPHPLIETHLTFFVEACNWQQRTGIDDSDFEMAAEYLMEEFANEMFGVGSEMSA